MYRHSGRLRVPDDVRGGLTQGPGHEGTLTLRNVLGAAGHIHTDPGGAQGGTRGLHLAGQVRGPQAGAAGFIVKDTPPEALAEAIRKVHAGLRVIDPELAQESVLLGPNPLTEREKEVLLAAATGSDAREIATRLSLGEGTVRNYLSSAIAKTHARNRTEAARTAETNGWL